MPRGKMFIIKNHFYSTYKFGLDLKFDIKRRNERYYELFDRDWSRLN